MTGVQFSFTHRSFVLHAPYVGAVSGVGLGVIGRIWNRIPSHHKLPSHVALPLFPFLNYPMQVLMKGPGKYFIALAPVGILLAKAAYQSYQTKNLQPFKEQFFKKETLFACLSLTLSLSIVFTHSIWTPFFAWYGLSMEGLSEHVLLFVTLQEIFSIGLEAFHQPNATEPSSQKVLFPTMLFCIIFGIASSLFLFNTTLYYHTLSEVLSAFFLALIISFTSHRFT